MQTIHQVIQQHCLIQLDYLSPNIPLRQGSEVVGEPS